MRVLWIWHGMVVLGALTLFLPEVWGLSTFAPIFSALGVIFLTRSAAAGLGAGFVTGCLIAANGHPLVALQSLVADHLMPQISSSWHIGALLFTLLLGAFAGVQESSGGFTSILQWLHKGRRPPKQRVLNSVYGIGLLCFFDGLANSMLTGRISRQAADQAGISREKLAWVVDSTSSPVACVAFISTWIATQLTLIGDSLPEADAYVLYFRSIPGNPYCLLTLILIPLAIHFRWEPKLMARYPAREPSQEGEETFCSAPWRVLVPLVVLAVSIAAGFQIWSGNAIDLFSLEAWRSATSSSAGPTALVAGAISGLIAACLCHPKTTPGHWGKAAQRGAAGLLPALVILILAWCLGSVFRTLGAAEAIQTLLGESVQAAWLPLAVFGVASLTAFSTGSSWGTMALMMPLALGVLSQTSAPEDLLSIAPAVIGAVFGGAVFGDHASPFSDTTIVSALAAGCEPIDHVLSQLPYATATAISATGAYVMIAIGLHPAVATGLAAIGLTSAIVLLGRRPCA